MVSGFDYLLPYLVIGILYNITITFTSKAHHLYSYLLLLLCLRFVDFKKAARNLIGII